MTVACLLIPSLVLACELARRPALAGKPVVLTDEAESFLSDAKSAWPMARCLNADRSSRAVSGPRLTDWGYHRAAGSSLEKPSRLVLAST